MSKSVLIWDFDGVMADSNQFVFNYWQQAFAAEGIDFNFKDYQATFTYRFPFDYLRENYGETLVKKIYHDYSAYEELRYPEVVAAYPEFLEHFKQLHQNYQHFIVSSNLESVIKPWLEKYQLHSYFTDIIGRETPGYKDEKIIQLATKRQLSLSNIQFIGDTISDMEHAQRAGVQAVGVTWGVHSRRQLESVTSGPIHDTIPSLFKSLCINAS